MVICLERGADVHMVQLMSLPLTVSCFSKIQIGFTFLVPAYLGSPGKRAVKRVCCCGLASCTTSPKQIKVTEFDPDQYGMQPTIYVNSVYPSPSYVGSSNSVNVSRFHFR